MLLEFGLEMLPEVFNGIEVRGLGRPLQGDDVIVRKPLICLFLNGLGVHNYFGAAFIAQPDNHPTIQIDTALSPASAYAIDIMHFRSTEITVAVT